MTSPAALYQQHLQQPGFVKDPAQALAVQHLERVYAELLAQPSRSRWLRFNKPQPVKGLYLWGGVGRGKTYLMDLFFESLPLTEKLRIHFHRFMQRIHEELRHCRGEKDPLKHVAQNLAKQTRILCFDEFAVNDIADAMLLGILLQNLFAEGVCLVATSNLAPDDLYQDGLQRELFLPAIAEIKAHAEILNVDAGVDYRWRHLTPTQRYYSPLVNEREFMQTHFNALSHGVAADSSALSIEGRMIPAIAHSASVVWFEFSVICGDGRAVPDYIAIAKKYHSVLISNIPQLTNSMDEYARRFINLVDEFYDSRINLIVSATVPMQQLYKGERLQFEFQRTLSRLQEMQSDEYWNEARVNKENDDAK
jgi:cell division protein ZapE